MAFSPRRWIWNLLIGIDQLGNTLLGGAPDETISARAGRGKTKHWYWRWLAHGLDKIDPHHTNDAVRSEQERIHLPSEYRKGRP